RGLGQGVCPAAELGTNGTRWRQGFGQGPGPGERPARRARPRAGGGSRRSFSRLVEGRRGPTQGGKAGQQSVGRGGSRSETLGGMCSARPKADGRGGACPSRLEEGGKGYGCMAENRTPVATDQRGLGTDHAGRGIEHAGQGGSGVGPDLAAIAGRRFRQEQTALAATGDAQLLGSDAGSTREVAVPQRSEPSGGAAGDAAPPTGTAAGRKPQGGRPAWRAAAGRGGPGQSRGGRRAGGGCGAGDPASRLPGQQPGGVHQQRAAHAPSPAPENDP